MNKKSGRKVSIILVLAIVALVVYLIIDSVKLGVDINDKKDKVDDLTESISVQNEMNSDIEDILKDENESKYLENIAREDYDYILPDERVYADSAN